MVQATDLWDGDDVPDSGWLYRTAIRAILVEREVRPGTVVVVEVGGQDAIQVAFVEHHDVIETLAPNRTDDTLDVRILLGCLRCCDDLSNSHGLDTLAEALTI